MVIKGLNSNWLILDLKTHFVCENQDESLRLTHPEPITPLLNVKMGWVSTTTTTDECVRRLCYYWESFFKWRIRDLGHLCNTMYRFPLIPWFTFISTVSRLKFNSSSRTQQVYLCYITSFNSLLVLLHLLNLVLQLP